MSLVHEIVNVVSAKIGPTVCEPDLSCFVPDRVPQPLPGTQDVAVEFHCNVTESPDETDGADGVRLADGGAGITLTVTLLLTAPPFVPVQVTEKLAVDVKTGVVAFPYVLVLVDHPEVLQDAVL